MKKFSKKVALLLGALAVIYSPAFAQNEEQAIKDIRTRYQQVNRHIATCQSQQTPAETCPYYHSVLHWNKHNKSSEIGLSKEVITQFWLDVPAGKEELKLNKVNRVDDLWGRKISEEFLYDDEQQLIFYYSHDSIYPRFEVRLYFTNGELIKSIGDDKQYIKTITPQVLRQAKTLVDIAAGD